ncbi:(d)CMP kinase [Bauldia litoralis]|uniref:Cytidylate kinase n=1 Tax=Bauldia litoralis TaxID=665467 RepID=A0A1G6BKW7_9HYPH|nr:(d)CMP kinase [Bauldia litoralis]SDB21259.1 cytidylate kinase [Bauldia litoralis]
MLIAIDGPAASGKGTLARRLAAHYRLRHLDTGLTFRAVGAELVASGRPLDDERAAITIAETLDLEHLDRERLNAHGVGEAASKVAVMPGFRKAMVARQRAFAREGAGAVLDGRDIGTVVLPDATAKLFVTADAATRAMRRAAEIRSRGGEASDEAILADLARRDRRDAERATAPLKAAEDAHLLDTTGMDIETAFRAAVDIVERARAERD